MVVLGLQTRNKSMIKWFVIASVRDGKRAPKSKSANVYWSGGKWVYFPAPKLAAIYVSREIYYLL